MDEVISRRWVESRWRQALRLHSELMRLEKMRGAASAAKYAALIRKALRSGQESIAVTTQSLLASKYREEGLLRRSAAIEAKLRRLTPIHRPRTIARYELWRRLELSDAGPPTRPPENVRGSLAHRILLSSYGRLAKTRVRDLRALHERAVAEGKHLEAALCDLFLLAEFRKAGDRKNERSAVADLKMRERRFGIRDGRGRLLSDSIVR